MSNKYQEALNRVAAICKEYVDYEMGLDSLPKKDQVAIDTLQQLVDKATPMKVVVDELCWDDTACPICKKSFLRKGELDGCNYCPNCGQKLAY